MARGPRARPIAGAGMVVGSLARTARGAPANAGRLVRAAGIACQLIPGRRRAGLPRLPRRSDLAALARRLSGPCETMRSRPMIGAAPRYFSAGFDLNLDSAQPNDILAESGPPTSRSAAFRREA